MINKKVKGLAGRLQKKVVRQPWKALGFAIALLIVVTPIILLLVMLVKYSINVPWWDQASFVDLMTKLHNGNLTVYDLWRQHNEHRILVPQVVELAVGQVTGFNFRVPILLNFLTAVGSFGLMISMLKRTFTKNYLVLILAIPVAWLMFSPIQWTNWLWGFQLAFFMSIFFATFTIWLLIKNRISAHRGLFILALVTATITTYCNGNGLLIWPIGLAIILWKRIGNKRIIAWCGIGLVVIASYLYKFHRSPDSLPLSVVIKEPVAVAKYALAYLGRNLALTPISARWVGLVLVVVMMISTLFVYKRGKLNEIISWLGLGAYSLLTAMLAAISRLNYGTDHGFISNSYPTISVIFILATIAISVFALGIFLESFSGRQMTDHVVVLMIFGALCALPLSAFVKNYQAGSSQLKGLGQHLSVVRNCVYAAKSKDDDCLLNLYPDKALAWGYVQELKDLHWGDFK